MTRHRLAARARTTALLGAAMLLAACAVQLVDPYDEVIDDGLMTFNQDFLQFMAGIKENVPSEDASYASNTSFYNAQQAAIGTLVQRAKASDPGGRCLERGADAGRGAAGRFDRPARRGDDRSAAADAAAAPRSCSPTSRSS